MTHGESSGYDRNFFFKPELIEKPRWNESVFIQKSLRTYETYFPWICIRIWIVRENLVLRRKNKSSIGGLAHAYSTQHHPDHGTTLSTIFKLFQIIELKSVRYQLKTDQRYSNFFNHIEVFRVSTVTISPK